MGHAMTDSCETIEVSRRIDAPAARIFDVLADPRRHTEIDGSDMLRGTASDDVITGVGDVFSMKRYLESLGGDYSMVNCVVEFERDRRIGWEPAAGDAVATQDGEYPVGVPPGHRWSFELTTDGANGTIVTEKYDCAAAPESVRAAVRNGDVWVDAMTSTLERLDALCRP
jgi:hypothetical protein